MATVRRCIKTAVQTMLFDINRGSQSVGGSENEWSASRGLEREVRRGFYIFLDTSHKNRKAALIAAKKLGVYPPASRARARYIR